MNGRIQGPLKLATGGDLGAGESPKRAFGLVALVTGIALQRFDALTRDDRNHENCSY